MYSLITIPYILFYMLYDGWGLLPAIIAFAPQVVFYAVTPFFHRFGSTAGAVYLCTMWLIFGLASCLFFGRDSGLQFFFLPGAAASILVFGAERLALSGLVALIALCAFLVVEIVLVQPISFLHVEPVFLQVLYYMTVPFTFLLIFTTSFFAFKEAAQAETALETEYRFSERLLQNILPRAVADRLKDHRTQLVADHVDSATILFADIVNFTPRAARWGPQQVVAFLSQIFGRFDAIAMKHGLEKIKTIGDAYMVAAGVPIPRKDHVQALASMGLDLVAAVQRISVEENMAIGVRVGMASGPMMAGIIGKNKFSYDVWGDPVNLASRLEQSSTPGAIAICPTCADRLHEGFELERRGTIDIKGVGPQESWYLVGRK